MAEATQLRTKRGTEIFAVRRVERAVAEAVVGALEGNDAVFARGQNRRLERCFNRFKARAAEYCLRLARFPRPSPVAPRLLSPPPLERDPAQLARQCRLERVRVQVPHR